MAMSVGYDIYRQVLGNEFKWMDRVKGLEEARASVETFGATSPGDYVIYDFRRRAIVEVLALLSDRMVA